MGTPALGQLAFELPAAPALRREDFFVSPSNALALATLDRWRDWPGGRTLLMGPRGSGKTHLARIWALGTGAEFQSAQALESADVPTLACAPAVALEDAEAVAGNAGCEMALFHLLNLCAAREVPILLTAALPPRDWGPVLPDLASRLQAMPVARLSQPDDALLSAVLVKLFADRQIMVAPALISYLVSRMDRAFPAAQALVASLDRAGLAEGRAVTRSLAAEVMDRADRHGP